MDNTFALQVKDLSVELNDQIIIDNLSFDVKKGVCYGEPHHALTTENVKELYGVGDNYCKFRLVCSFCTI